MKSGLKRLNLERLERREVLTATFMEVEFNNSKSTANTFELDSFDQSADLMGTSQNQNDKDWFRFTTPTAGTLSVRVGAPNNEFAALEIETANGTEILSTDPNDGINTASAQVDAGQTLFVRLRAKADATSDYAANITLNDGGTIGGGGTGGGGGNVDPPTGITAETESNDRRSQANLFGFDNHNSAQLTGVSNSDRDTDFFKFTMPQDGDVALTVHSSNGNFAQLEIENRFGIRVFETQPNDGINSGLVTLAGGETYFARLRSKTDNAADYVVNLQVSAPTGPIAGAGPTGTSNGLGGGSDDSGHEFQTNGSPFDTPDVADDACVSHRPARLISLNLTNIDSGHTTHTRRTAYYDAVDEALRHYETDDFRP